VQPAAGLAQLPGMAGGGLARPQLQMEWVRQQSVSWLCVDCDRAPAGVAAASGRETRRCGGRDRPPRRQFELCTDAAQLRAVGGVLGTACILCCGCSAFLWDHQPLLRLAAASSAARHVVWDCGCALLVRCFGPLPALYCDSGAAVHVLWSGLWDPLVALWHAAGSAWFDTETMAWRRWGSLHVGY
jgi:hypothetical protein